jgi:signal transduction histidine kinase
MIGLAGLIEHALPGDHPARADLDRLMEAGEQASHLAGQLLAFSKQAPKKPQAVDVNTAVVHSLKLLKGAFDPDIQIEHRLAGDSLMVQADEMQLKQVVMNLCLNAREAMGQGGKLTVTTERLSGHAEDNHDEDSHDENNGQQWVRLSVQDTGHGIDEDIQARIFEPFFSTKDRGTGLGLAVVRRIVESFGGRIQVYSKPQQGTRMDVWLKRFTPEDRSA